MAKVTIYTTPICPFCVYAKRLLQLKGVDFDEVNVAFDAGLREEMMKRAGGMMTVPQFSWATRMWAVTMSSTRSTGSRQTRSVTGKAMKTIRAACVQARSSDDVQENLKIASGFIREAHAKGARFIGTPENTCLMAADGGAKLEKSFPEDKDPALPSVPAAGGGAWHLAADRFAGDQGVRHQDRQPFLSHRARWPRSCALRQDPSL